MEGYIHGLMAVYHARLLRSLSCVLGARRERERVSGYEREKGKGDKHSVREREEELSEREKEKSEGREKRRGSE